MSDWRPIDTAPKDGTRILAYVHGEVDVIRWSISPLECETWRGGDGRPLSETPTHWRPLPAKPGAAADG